MLISIVVPVSTDKWNAAVQEAARQYLNPGVDFMVKNIAHGPEAVQSEYDEARVAAHTIEEAMKLEEAGSDAIIIWCFSDPGLNGAREVVRAPVLGIGETSQTFSLNLADSIGVITTLPQSINRIFRKIKARKLDGRIKAIKPLNIPVLEYDQVAKVTAQAVETARDLVENHGVEAIILGCGSIVGAARAITEELSIPVVEPGPITLAQAELMVKTGLGHSQKAFLRPRPVPEH